MIDTRLDEIKIVKILSVVKRAAMEISPNCDQNPSL